MTCRTRCVKSKEGSFCKRCGDKMFYAAWHGAWMNRKRLNAKSRTYYRKHRKEILAKMAGRISSLPTFGYNKNKNVMYTGEVTPFAKEMIRKVKEKVLKDCIRHPEKYL